MTEFYWISRLTAIHDGFEVTFAISTIVAVMSVVGYLIALDTPVVAKVIKKWLIVSSIVSTLTGIGYILTPTTSEMLAIYATEKTVDYINGNETLQGIPDKLINYIDSILSVRKD